MSFFAPAAAWLALFLIPLIAFYFLKLKRPKQEVSSLVLWRQVLDDQRVNSPFQRFKRNLLLLLQILLLLFLILAAMQPFLRGDPKNSLRQPVLIDCSASMAALDKEGGKSRLDLAKETVGDMIDGLLPDEQMCLISFGFSARQATPFTANKIELRAALDALSADDVPGEIDDALRLAQAISRTAPFTEAVVVSDGNLPGEATVDLPFALRFQKIETGGENVGITEFSARRADEGAWEVFAQIEASTANSAAATAQLWTDPAGGTEEPVLLGEDTVAMGLEGSARLSFLVPGSAGSHLRLELVPDTFDSLPSDNVAYLDLPQLRDLSAYVSPKLAGYAHALSILQNVTVDSDPASLGDFDIIVTTDFADLETRSAPVVLTVGAVPEKIAGLIAETTMEGNVVVDWRRDSPLLRHVDFTEVILTDLPTLAPEVSEEDFESSGYRVLAHGRLGPLILSEEGAGSARYHLLFHTDRSTLPYRVAFPILCANLLAQAREFAGLAEIRARRTGILPAIPAPPAAEFTVDPGDTKVQSNPSGLIEGLSAKTARRLTLTGGGRTLTVGASLLSPSETRLKSVDQIRTREFRAEAQTTGIKSDRPLWFPLALIALALLLIEWWFFHRRRGHRRTKPTSNRPARA